MIKYETVVFVDDIERHYEASSDTYQKAKFLSEKKARAFLRRKNLSVRMDNVIKELCPECENTTIITVHDLDVPLPQETFDDFDFMLSSDWSM